jgi:transcriptional regulator with XRE-family HTH domain
MEHGLFNAEQFRRRLAECTEVELTELRRSASSAASRHGPKRNVIVSALATYDLARGIRMVIGERLKALREQKSMSQGDIEKRTRLLRVYISRVENGHTVPAIATLEKFAQALEVPMYQLFYDGEKPPVLEPAESTEDGWGSSGRDARVLSRFRRLLRRTSKADLKLLLFVAQKMSQRRGRAVD